MKPFVLLLLTLISQVVFASPAHILRCEVELTARKWAVSIYAYGPQFEAGRVALLLEEMHWNGQAAEVFFEDDTESDLKWATIIDSTKGFISDATVYPMGGMTGFIEVKGKGPAVIDVFTARVSYKALISSSLMVWRLPPQTPASCQYFMAPATFPFVRNRR